MTALHEAALWGSGDAARMLIAHGAPVDLPEQEGDTPLTLAAMKGGDSAHMHALLHTHTHTHAHTHRSRFACHPGHACIVKLLLDTGCAVDALNDMGRSALLEAAEHGYNDIVKLLLERNANVDLQDHEGKLFAHYLVAKQCRWNEMRKHA